jgi:hypothetical protein
LNLYLPTAQGIVRPGSDSQTGYKAEVILDNLSDAGARITTMRARFPRYILAEFNTHRMFSRNAPSSRAIPVKRRVAMTINDPVFPIEWGRNKAGMQATELLTPELEAQAKEAWTRGIQFCAHTAQQLDELKVHKQIANRPFEWCCWIEVVFTATDTGRGPLPWDNFFTQRDHEDAQPEFHHVAGLLLEAYLASKPYEVPDGYPHLPFILDDEASYPIEKLVQASVGRCARVSYWNFTDGDRNILNDIRLYHDLLSADPPHMSPFEHVALALVHAGTRSGNFRGWQQHRIKVFGHNQTRHVLLEDQRRALGVGLPKDERPMVA